MVVINYVSYLMGYSTYLNATDAKPERLEELEMEMEMEGLEATLDVCIPLVSMTQSFDLGSRLEKERAELV